MIARLYIQTKQRDGITYLKDAYFTPPFKLANIRENHLENTLSLVLMSSSPGILNGDEYHLQVDVDSGCALRLTTQSYQRLFHMVGSASQTMQVNMAGGSSFCYLPHPTVPHAGSNFTSRNKILMSASCNLIWGEILTCGRKQNGEEFLFTRYHNVTEIYLEGKLIIKENLIIAPKLINMNTMGQLEGFTHQASLVIINKEVSAKNFKSAIANFLATQNAIAYGVTETPGNGMLLRILGHKAEQLHHNLAQIAAMVEAVTQKQFHDA